MGGSFRIATIAGIEIKVHISFFLILLLGAFQGMGYGVTGAIYGVILMLLLFLCVTLHELGHSLAALRFGVPVREIILLPIGGVAVMSRAADKAWQELAIAAAGPLVNVIIAGILFGITAAMGIWATMDVSVLQNLMQPSLNTMLLWLLQANVMLALFNLLPAFPLDGGRILRAFLAMIMPYQRATRIATTVGQVLAIGLGVLGIMTGNFILAVVALFIFFGAGQEQTYGNAQTVLQTLKVGDTYNKHALTLDVNDRVSKVVDYILTSYQPDFAVLQTGRLVGVVTRDDVLRAMAQHTDDVLVYTIMQRSFERVAANDALDAVHAHLVAQGERIAAVFHGERYLGLVSIEDISEAVMIGAFQNRQRKARTDAGLPPLAPEHSTTPPEHPFEEPEVPEAPTQSPEVIALHERLAAKRRRLGALQIQQSYFQEKTPPRMRAEIVELEQEIAQLLEALQQHEQPLTSVQ